MAINPYFMDTQSQQHLYEDLIIESVKIYGRDTYYIPREIVSYDELLNEDIPSKFPHAYKVEMYIDDIDGFGGEGDIFTKFGVEIRDAATFVVSRRRWRQTTSRSEIVCERPREGDLIYLPMSKSLFQIMHVEHEVPFYQLNNLPTYKMRCELFEYSGEDLDTGVPDIDGIERSYAYTYDLQLDSSGVGDGFELNENVTMTLSTGVELTGEVSAWSDSDNVLSIIHLGASDGDYHEPPTGGVVVGSIVRDSDGSGTNIYSRVLINSWSEDNKLDEREQNKIFEGFENDFLDFTESNPFGDPS